MHTYVRVVSLFALVRRCYTLSESGAAGLVQGHTAVTVGTDMVMFGGIVNGHRTAEVCTRRAALLNT